MKKFLLAITVLLGVISFANADNLDNATQWMNANGLTIYNNTTDFKADRGLRRDEAAKFFVQFATLLGKTGYVKTDAQCTFSDINQSWSDLKTIVVESCKLGFFQGNKGKFSPQNQLTNAQSITVLVRLIAGMQSEVGVSHRADNYYTKANELNLLNNVVMNNKDNIATRGNVGIIIYAGNASLSSQTSTCLPTTIPWIRIISPNGGETYTVGQQITVTWTGCNIPEQELVVSLQYVSPDNGSVVYTGTSNDGSETFSIPQISLFTQRQYQFGNFYRAFIETPGVDAQPQIYVSDYSDNQFRIITSL